jgi:hypothetical protein
MKRMNVIMRNENNSDDEHASSSSFYEGSSSGGGASRKYECDNCRAEFPNKTTLDRHMLFCRTLADIRRGSSSQSTAATLAARMPEDELMPTQREMFILIQELAAKYNKVKDELDVMKQWAKMVGRRIGGVAAATGSTGNGGGGAALTAGLDFTSVTRQKRQNMEVILNEEDAEHPDLAELRPGFTEWLSSDTSIVLTDADLNNVFNEDLVSGITAAILRVMSEYTTESGKSHLVPLKLADIKQGAFYIYDTAFRVGADSTAISVSDPPIQGARKWRTMEPCEFQLLVRTFHKLLFKEFKKWQDRNWEAQQQMTKQRQKAATSYHQVMSSFQCSPAMATCDGLYMEYGGGGGGGGGGGDSHDEPVTPPVTGADTILSEDFATLYNKYADKMMGGALSDDTILSRVRAKLWKDMKAWRL